MGIFKFRFYLCFIILVFFLSACSKNPVDTWGYTPFRLNDDWPLSTPEEQGVDPDIMQDTYNSAGRLDNIYSLLVVKNGYLIGEAYYNGEDFNDANPTASVTKSVVSALTGIALQENVLTDTDQKMADFFPELDWQNIDPRKSEITIRQILQMRSGYPWEEFSNHLNLLISRYNWIPLLEEIPLSGNPGIQFGYSNLTAHTMAIILSRSAESTLISYAQEKLFDPLGVNIPYWPSDSLGYNYGSGDMAMTPRDLAKFGLLYLNNGLYDDNQIVPADWVAESLESYSFNVYGRRILTYFRGLDYGYLWWASSAGDYEFNFAWGHGGQLVVLIHELNMVIVSTADHLAGQFGDAAWQQEKAVMDLVGEFISRL